MGKRLTTVHVGFALKIEHDTEDELEDGIANMDYSITPAEQFPMSLVGVELREWEVHWDEDN